MKIRTDFVTNSSSSSFIVGFTNRECVEDVLSRENTYGYYDIILDDIISQGNSITKKQAIFEFKEEKYWDALCIVAKKHGISYYDMFEKEKEYQNEIDAALDKLTEKFSKKIDKYGYLALVSYSDNCGLDEARLEHEIVPQLSCTVARFSHH